MYLLYCDDREHLHRVWFLWWALLKTKRYEKFQSTRWWLWEMNFFCDHVDFCRRISRRFWFHQPLFRTRFFNSIPKFFQFTAHCDFGNKRDTYCWINSFCNFSDTFWKGQDVIAQLDLTKVIQWFIPCCISPHVTQKAHLVNPSSTATIFFRLNVFIPESCRCCCSKAMLDKKSFYFFLCFQERKISLNENCPVWYCAERKKINWYYPQNGLWGFGEWTSNLSPTSGSGSNINHESALSQQKAVLFANFFKFVSSAGVVAVRLWLLDKLIANMPSEPSSSRMLPTQHTLGGRIVGAGFLLLLSCCSSLFWEATTKPAVCGHATAIQCSERWLGGEPQQR